MTLHKHDNNDYLKLHEHFHVIKSLVSVDARGCGIMILVVTLSGFSNYVRLESPYFWQDLPIETECEIYIKFIGPRSLLS